MDQQQTLLSDQDRHNNQTAGVTIAYAGGNPSSPSKKGEAYTAKSLFFCLVLDNPFFEAPPPRTEKVEFLEQGSTEPGSPKALMRDDDLLLVQETDPGAPTKFEKVIEIILRLEKRGLHVEPDAMLVPTSEGQLCNLSEFPDNHFAGFSLNRAALLMSPDGDEIYIKLHASRSTLLGFAEVQGVVLNTHPLSFGGGAPLPYSKDQAKKLDESVRLFCEAFPELAEMEDDDGNKLSKKPQGFTLDVPDKMRLVTRLVRESWQFGGCGIQIAELKHRKILVRHFFPLHNESYQEAYGLKQWASFGQMFSWHPFYQIEEHIVKYFGESVSLYFVWIRKYSLFLRYIAFFGLVAGILDMINRTHCAIHASTYYNASSSTNSTAVTTPGYCRLLPMPVINMVFSVICCVWGVAWIFKWRRIESEFAMRYGQDAQVGQELVRDEFEQADEPVELEVEQLYRMDFSYPLTLRNKPDGTMMQLQDNYKKRIFMRYFVSYPAIAILSSGMVTALYYTTYWRFLDPTDTAVTFGSSIVTTLIGFVFGILFDKGIGYLNAIENNRTDTEQEEQTISKSFLFYFFSYYFAMFTIALWPSKISDEDRLNQLYVQMAIITIAKPMVQNVVESLTPLINAQLRIRTDMHDGSFSKGLISLITCEKMDDNTAGLSPSEAEGRKLWLEAQMEPYESTSGDYLEITLQYGYMTMFAATFPWAAVAAFFYNILEIRVDARKILLECQRPVARPANTIGAWNGIFLFLSSLSVVTNGFLISIMSSAPSEMGLPTSDADRYKIFTIVQYILIGAFFVIFAWFSGNSELHNKLKSKFHILNNRATRERLSKKMRESADKRRAAPSA